MASSCRRPEHSAPPEVVSNLGYLKWRLLVDAKASAICFGGVKESLKTFAWICRCCFYSQFNLIYSQHIPLNWQYCFRLCYFINVTILPWQATLSWVCWWWIVNLFFALTSYHLHSFTMKRRLRNILKSKLFYIILSVSMLNVVKLMKFFLHSYLDLCSFWRTVKCSLIKDSRPVLVKTVFSMNYIFCELAR